MEELLPRLSGPESQHREFGVGVPFCSGGLDADGFPARWDSLCCDHIFKEKNLQGGLDDELLVRGPGLVSGELASIKVRTTAAPFKRDAKESGNANALPVAAEQAPQSTESNDSHGATDSHAAAPGMSLRSGQIKSHASVSHAEAPSDSDGDQQAGSLPRKRRRRRTAAAEDYVYSQHSDPEEKKLEKRRAKNRRTARASRERKQAELHQMRADLGARTAEVAQLKELLAAKEAQIAQMAAAAGSPFRGPPSGAGGESTKRRASESAVLKACIYLVNCMLTTRTAPLKTPSLPSCLTTCSPALSGDDVPQLKRELRSLFEQLPTAEQTPVYHKLQEALGRNGRGKAAQERLEKWLTTEMSDESGL